MLRALQPALERAAALGWSLVSGGALGVDGRAHRDALALAIPQVAVLPCGRDRVYPPRHAGLFAAMAEAPEASLLFAHPVGTAPARGMFASRNAIVVELADAVLVAQARARSGSMITGRLALRRAVPLAAFAGSRGCGMLIAAGARALPDPRVDDPSCQVAAWLRDPRAPAHGSPAGSDAWAALDLDWLRARLLAAGPGGLAPDSLDDPEAAFAGLCEAELAGLVTEAHPGRWVLIR